ncbi:Uncharacterised protein [Serratia marcescens]|nr:Uncharacterised protein [Serratia marcescens]
MAHQRGRQQVEGVQPGDGDKQHGEPRNGDGGFFRLACAAAADVARQQQQERRQHHHADHLGDHRRIFGVRPDGVPGGDHLSHFVNGGAGVDAEGFLAERQPLEVFIQLIQPRVNEDSQGAEHHHGRDRYRHFAGIGLQHRLGGHHRRRAANAAAGADQYRGLAVDAEHFLAEPTGQQEGGDQGQRVDDNAAGAHVSDLLKGQPEAVKNNPQTQQALFGQLHAAVTNGLPAGVQRVAHQNAEQDRQRQRPQPQLRHPGNIAGPDGQRGERAGQRQPRHQPRQAEQRKASLGVSVSGISRHKSQSFSLFLAVKSTFGLNKREIDYIFITYLNKWYCVRHWHKVALRLG